MCVFFRERSLILQRKDSPAKTGELRPLRHWRSNDVSLHEHIYAFCGALAKMTSVEREWAFSVLKCYILRGNYHASLAAFIKKIDDTAKWQVVPTKQRETDAAVAEAAAYTTGRARCGCRGYHG